MGRRTLSSREAVVLDLLLAAGCIAIGVWRELAFPAADRRMLHLPVGWYVAAQVIGGMALLWRRQWPIETGAAQAVLNLLSPTQASIVAVYTLGAHADRRRLAVATFAAIIAGWVLGAQLWNLADTWSGLVVLLVLFLTGLYVQARRSLIDALADRADRAERERGLLAERAVAAERTRIAREMHDLIAHRISMIVLQAGALRATAEGSATRDGIEEIRSTGSRTLDELRHLVGMLRDDADDGPEPETVALGDIIDDSVAGARRAGISVSLTTTGTPRPVALAVGRALQRVVQESLTNAAKHAPGARIGIETDYRPTEVAVRVRNTASARSGGVGGTGLIGLRERVGMLGGTLEAGRSADGVFEVTAVIPAGVRSDSSATGGGR